MASSAKDIQFKELKDTVSQLNTTIRTQNDLTLSPIPEPIEPEFIEVKAGRRGRKPKAD